jgi:hypothetical protein
MDRTHGPMRGRAWAPDDADVMNADMPRCIGKSGHTLGCVVLDHIRYVMGIMSTDVFYGGFSSVFDRYLIGI